MCYPLTPVSIKIRESPCKIPFAIDLTTTRLPSSESSISSGLRRNAVCLRIRRWHRIASSLRQHQSRPAQDRRAVLLLLTLDFSSFAFFIVFLETFDRGRLLAHVINHKRHAEIVETVAPGQLHDNIETDKIVAGIEHTNVAFSTADIDKLFRD